MFVSHVGLQCADFAASVRFYDAVLATLGGGRIVDMSPHAIGYGSRGPEFWINPYVGDAAFRESHIAFTASTPAEVDAFFAAAQELGAEELHAPREWPEYHGDGLIGYYAAFVRDPDGNNVEAACLQFGRIVAA
jgi:catechol 2,3-dioxygenase-like lactoylglutathione lyase family enzyme